MVNPMAGALPHQRYARVNVPTVGNGAFLLSGLSNMSLTNANIFIP